MADRANDEMLSVKSDLVSILDDEGESFGLQSIKSSSCRQTQKKVRVWTNVLIGNFAYPVHIKPTHLEYTSGQPLSKRDFPSFL